MLLFLHNIHEKIMCLVIFLLVLDTVFVPGLLGVFFFVRQGGLVTRIVHIQKMMLFLHLHFSFVMNKTTSPRSYSSDIVHWPAINPSTKNEIGTFALAGPCWLFWVCMADLFAFNAEGNALSEDRVVISKVEKSRPLSIRGKWSRGVYYRWWSRGLCSGRILWSYCRWRDRAGNHIQSRSKVIRQCSSCSSNFWRSIDIHNFMDKKFADMHLSGLLPFRLNSSDLSGILLGNPTNL